MDLEEFYRTKVKPLVLEGLSVLHISNDDGSVEFWKKRANLFDLALLCIDAYVYDKRRVDMELNTLKEFVEGLKGGDKK